MLENKSIIITGASSGIGASAAVKFAEHGAMVVLGARRGELLGKLVEKIRVKGGKATSLAGDIRDEEFAASLVRLAQEEFGGLDAAFNNGGVLGDLGPVPEMDSSNWANVVSTNLNSAFFAAKHQIPAMKSRGGGSVVFTSSFVGHSVGMPGMGAYAAAKAGIVGLTQVLAAEHGQENIRANALLPGGTRTAMVGDDHAVHEFVSGLHALKRMADPEEIANAALFLVSDQSSFVTGTAFLADGGNSINKT